MAPTLQPLPWIAPVTTQQGSYINPDWGRWFDILRTSVGNAAVTLGDPVALTNQGASISTTAIPLLALANGYYKVNWYARVTTADAVSSSLAVTIGWTESSVSLTKAFTALTGNTTSTVDGQSVVVLIDQNSALTYATTYASNTPGAMRYRLSVIVESV